MEGKTGPFPCDVASELTYGGRDAAKSGISFTSVAEICL